MRRVFTCGTSEFTGSDWLIWRSPLHHLVCLLYGPQPVQLFLSYLYLSTVSFGLTFLAKVPEPDTDTATMKPQKSGRVSNAKPSGIQRKALLNAAKQKSSAARRSSIRTPNASQTDLDESEIGSSSAGSAAQSDQSMLQTEDSFEEAPPATRRDYSYLRAKTRRVPKQTVQSTWRSLPQPVQQRVRDVVLTAKRSVVYNYRSQQKSLEANTVIGELQKVLLKRLPRMPFPPNTKEGNFDLEKLLDRSVSITVTPGGGNMLTVVADIGNPAHVKLAFSRLAEKRA
jgi:hypothetical protein